MSMRDRLHVMVVDDMSTSRALLVQGLEALGILNYITENDGVKALNRLDVRPVHLVISDYNMPSLNGLGLLEELRKNVRTQKIAFILVTGSPTDDLATRGRALQVNSILKKPFTTMQLKECIETAIGQPL